MDFFFPEDNLTRNVPEETRITTLSALPYPDGRRVHVNIEMTPFQKRPHIEILLTDADHEEVASTTIVEPMGWKLELTMHVRGEVNNPYTLEATLYYPDGPRQEPQTFSLEVVPLQSTGEPDSTTKEDPNASS